MELGVTAGQAHSWRLGEQLIELKKFSRMQHTQGNGKYEEETKMQR